MARKGRLPARVKPMLAITAAMLAINAAAWISSSFADAYAEYIFSPLSSLLTRLTGLFPFSLGEVMIALGIIAAAAVPVILVLALAFKKRALAKGTGLFLGGVLVFILTAETLNCFVLYHTTELSEKYHGGAGKDGFTSKQLYDVCAETIAAANGSDLAVSRDKEGAVILPENVTELAAEAMNNIACDYTLLYGSYPQAKKIHCSMLMTQLDLQGIYFPFSLEANYNSELSPARIPCTILHELSHLKGFIREDEACFIAYRACISSDSPELRYSGYLSAMNYLLNAAYGSVSAEEYSGLCEMISDEVRKDNTFVSEEYRQRIAAEAILPTEAVSAVSERAMDATLKLNGVADGKKSYGRMADLILEYNYYIRDNG